MKKSAISGAVACPPDANPCKAMDFSHLNPEFCMDLRLALNCNKM